MKKLGLLMMVVLLWICPTQADEYWDSGHHEIVDGDIYNEIWMSNDATATMFGGDVFKLETHNISFFDMHGGEMDILSTHDDSEIDIYGDSIGTMYIYDNSTINIFSFSLTGLGAVGNSSINLYAYDVFHHTTGGSNHNGWVEGNFLADDVYFSFDLLQEDSFLHVNVVPEPMTILLLGLGAVGIQRKC